MESQFMEGEISAVRAADGKGWRWRFLSTGGAEMLGPRLLKTKKAAQQAGDEWLRGINEARQG